MHLAWCDNQYLRRHVKTAANFEQRSAVPLPSSGLAIIKHSKEDEF